MRERDCRVGVTAAPLWSTVAVVAKTQHVIIGRSATAMERQWHLVRNNLKKNLPADDFDTLDLNLPTVVTRQRRSEDDSALLMDLVDGARLQVEATTTPLWSTVAATAKTQNVLIDRSLAVMFRQWHVVRNTLKKHLPADEFDTLESRASTSTSRRSRHRIMSQRSVCDTVR